MTALAGQPRNTDISGRDALPELDVKWLLSDEPQYSVSSVTGLQINQETALQASAVMACVTMLVEDIAKGEPKLYRRSDDGSRKPVKGHWFEPLLEDPNDWQTWEEFCSQMNLGLILRGNAYAVIVRDGRGRPLYFVPINPDRCALWQAPDGSLFIMVTRNGLHEMAVLKNEPLLIPYRDVLHLKWVSSNGLLGFSRISVGREIVGLSLAQEQQAARWMGNGAKPSGYLSTADTLEEGAAERMAKDWRSMYSGLQNSGRAAVLEQGLEWHPLSMTSSDLEFIASRRFQLEEIARMFRIPAAMIAEVGSSGRTDLNELAQYYVNYSISTYTNIWAKRLRKTLGFKAEGIEVGFDHSVLLRNDLKSRYDAYRMGVMGGFLTQNEARAEDGRVPMEGGDALLMPSNSTPFGSDKSGNAPDGAGRPSKSAPSADQKPGSGA